MKKRFGQNPWKRYSRRRQRHQEELTRRWRTWRRRRNRTRGGTIRIPRTVRSRNQRQRIVAPREFSLIANTAEVLRFFTVVKALASEGQRVYIDLGDLVSVSPDALFLLYAVVSDERFKTKLSGRGPSSPALEEIVRDSGFYQYLRVNTPAPAKPTGRLLEQQSRHVEPEAAKELVHFATEGITGTSQRHFASYRTLVEAMNNTRNHARERGAREYETWWAAVSCDRANRRARFTFIDNGIGIFRSLRVKLSARLLRRVGIHTNADLMRQLLHGELASSTGLPWRGRGFPKMFEDALQGRISRLTIISNNVLADVSEQRYSLLPKHSDFSGTILIWEVEG